MLSDGRTTTDAWLYTISSPIFGSGELIIGRAKVSQETLVMVSFSENRQSGSPKNNLRKQYLQQCSDP